MTSGNIFVTDLPITASLRQLAHIGVFGEKQGFVISMGEGDIFTQGVRITWTAPTLGIGTIPGRYNCSRASCRDAAVSNASSRYSTRHHTPGKHSTAGITPNRSGRSNAPPSYAALICFPTSSNSLLLSRSATSSRRYCRALETWCDRRCATSSTIRQRPHQRAFGQQVSSPTLGTTRRYRPCCAQSGSLPANQSSFILLSQLAPKELENRLLDLIEKKLFDMFITTEPRKADYLAKLILTLHDIQGQDTTIRPHLAGLRAEAQDWRVRAAAEAALAQT